MCLFSPLTENFTGRRGRAPRITAGSPNSGRCGSALKAWTRSNNPASSRGSPIRFSPAEGGVRIEGVVIDCSDDGRAHGIELLRVPA